MEVVGGKCYIYYKKIASYITTFPNISEHLYFIIIYNIIYNAKIQYKLAWIIFI